RSPKSPGFGDASHAPAKGSGLDKGLCDALPWAAGRTVALEAAYPCAACRGQGLSDQFRRDGRRLDKYNFGQGRTTYESPGFVLPPRFARMKRALSRLGEPTGRCKTSGEALSAKA